MFSSPVSSGFTSAVSLIIVTSQVKDILGIKAKGTTFVEIWCSIFEDIQNTKPYDTILGLTCIAVLMVLRIVAGMKIGPKDEKAQSKKHKIVNKTLWLIGTSRNALLVFICGAIGYAFKESVNVPFKLIGDIPSGLPEFGFPRFSLNANETISGKAETFRDMVAQLGSGLLVVPLIALMENIAICKAFCEY